MSSPGRVPTCLLPPRAGAGEIVVGGGVKLVLETSFSYHPLCTLKRTREAIGSERFECPGREGGIGSVGVHLILEICGGLSLRNLVPFKRAAASPKSGENVGDDG